MTSSTFHILSLDDDHTARHQLTTEDNMYHSPSISDGFWPFSCREVEACWRISKTVHSFFWGGGKYLQCEVRKDLGISQNQAPSQYSISIYKIRSQLAFQLLADTSIAFFSIFFYGTQQTSPISK